VLERVVSDPQGPIYLDGDAPTERRVADLLDRMTPEEKVGQLVGAAPYVSELVPDQLAEAIAEYGFGTTSPSGIAHGSNNGPRGFAEFANRFQRVAVEETRLGIPLLVTADALHGHASVNGATVFPHNLGLAASRDPELVREVAATTASEMRATGVNQNYSPTGDVVRDPRWGRTLETFGESPFLCAALAAAKVRGYQGGNAESGALDSERSVAATIKHFPAYGDPSRGEDTSPVDRSASTIRRAFLPPFEAAVDAGVMSVMPTYSAVDGEPIHGSRRFLTGMLRDELDFAGPAVSDWEAVAQLTEHHRTAATMHEAVRQATDAGLDVASVGGIEHVEHLTALVEDGDVSEDRLDESVRRVLALKFRLGLFEEPYVDLERADQVVGTEAHREQSCEVARRTMTLLRNENDVLPLSPDLDSVFVTGPNADDLGNQCGGWTTSNLDATGVTVREGIEAAVSGDTRVEYERGSGIRSADEGEIESAAASADDAEAAVVVLGEDAYIHEFIPNDLGNRHVGEFPTRSELALPTTQRDLLQAVHATGTPTVLVLVTGRPLAVSWAAEHVSGILMAYHPGREGGTAVAETLFGTHNPSGKLPISVPRSTGHLPTRFNRLKHPRVLHEDAFPPSYDPLFEFGHGLSYTEFACEDLDPSDDAVTPDETIEIEITVENTGDRRGREALDVFITDEVSSRVTPVRELRGLGAVTLDPAERETVKIPIDIADLGVAHPDRREVEPGTFEVSCSGLRATFEVTES
jgi:beta-glucosidase